MSQTYSWICRIDTLAAISWCTEYIKLAVIHINDNIDILCLRHDCNCCCWRMDSSAAFCLRHTLNTMHTAFVFKSGISTLSGDHKYNLFHTANTTLIYTDQLTFPAVSLCKSAVHTKQICGKKCCLISACTSTNLNKYVFLIIRIFWKKQKL